MFCENCGSKLSASDTYCSNCGHPVNNDIKIDLSKNNYQSTSNQKSKIAAALLAIFLGGLGIHNFYLGNTNKGLTQLLVCIIGGILTFGIASIVIEIWAFVEGILILTGSINTDSNGNPLCN